jgi:hypothetical protein
MLRANRLHDGEGGLDDIRARQSATTLRSMWSPARYRFEKGCCQGSKGCVTCDGRESLTFNGGLGNVRLAAAKNVPQARLGVRQAIFYERNCDRIFFTSAALE